MQHESKALQCKCVSVMAQCTILDMFRSDLQYSHYMLQRHHDPDKLLSEMNFTTHFNEKKVERVHDEQKSIYPLIFALFN